VRRILTRIALYITRDLEDLKILIIVSIASLHLQTMDFDEREDNDKDDVRG
jgi:hypothetical protein